MRVAKATADPDQRLQRYQEALGYMQKAAQTNKDLMLDMNTAFVETRIAELLRPKGSKEATRLYHRARQTNEGLLESDPKNQSVRRTLMEDLRALGEDSAERGVRLEAEIFRDRIIELAEQVKTLKMSNRTQGLIPRGYASVASSRFFSATKTAHANGLSVRWPSIDDCKPFPDTRVAMIWRNWRRRSRSFRLAHLLYKLASTRVHVHGVAASRDRCAPNDTPCQDTDGGCVCSNRNVTGISGFFFDELGALLHGRLIGIRRIGAECLDRPWSQSVLEGPNSPLRRPGTRLCECSPLRPPST